MNRPVLSIRDLTMRYGRQTALDGLSLDVQPGDLYGLIGPNGAGKTTAFRIIATILRPTHGHVRIDGRDIANRAHLRTVRGMLGYMPDSFGVYEDMTVQEYLAFFAAAYGIGNPRRQDLIRDVLELVDLAGKRDALVEALSRGMQQRLGIARVLIHDPALLILDEPASGLDPRARIEIRGLLAELRKMGKTIIISSHILSDLAEICNRIGIIERGRLLVDGTLQDVLRRVRRSPIVKLRVDDEPRAVEVLKALDFVVAARANGGSLAVEVAEGFTETWRLAEALVARGIHLSFMQAEDESLERAFIELTEGGVS